MPKRVTQLMKSTAGRLERAARSGRDVCKRFMAGLRRGSRKATKDVRSEATEAETVQPKQETLEKNTPGTSSAPPVSRRKKKRWSLDEFQVPPVPGKSRFHDFSIEPRIMRGIADQKFRYCTPVQELALRPATEGRDLVARAQTGTGKTAVFLVALYHRLLAERNRRPAPGHPQALVLAPTRELVIQIMKDGRKLGAYTPLTIVALYGGADYKKQEDMLQKRRCDIVVATPGRLLDFARQKKIILDACAILTIDEADRMLDMGFIPDVRRIVGSLPERRERQTMLFSATITDDVRRLADQWCSNPVSVEAGEETIDVEKIEQRVYLTTEREKYTMLYNLAAQSEGQRILVFTNMKSEASKLAKRLQENGIHCQVLTGDVQQHKRLSRLEDFRSGKTSLLVATDVAGRGIHIEGIAYVVNYTLPYEPEDYVHRIGRTGRAGAQGIAISFACEKGSFYLPAIEDYIGFSLSCIPPDDALLVPPPEPVEQPVKRKSGRKRPRNRSRSLKKTGA